MKNNSIKEIVKMINKAKKPLFICHENPDGDTYGSAFALRLGMGKDKCDIACASSIDWPFTELGIEKTINKLGKKYDLYVFLDCADKFRCGDSIREQISEGIPTINIDHHQSNTYYSTYNYVIECAATCELVFSILMENGNKISPKTASYLYMGIASDSGLFVHSYTTANTHYVAAKLLEFGAEFDRIGKLLFRTVSISTSLLAGRLYNNLEIFDEKIAISYLTQKDFKDTKANYEDSEGLISHLTNIDKMEICILLKQIDAKTYKASLRSTKKYNICQVAMEYGGGGHRQAAGCRFTGDIKKIKKELLNQIRQLKAE